MIDEAAIKKLELQLIKENLVIIENETVRHDPIKTGFVIFSYLLKGKK
ncbi:MAG: hypothetical protein PHY26_01670 [Bacilli bacterium]|nr:hypothetical protein [Bacilli bacterium]